MLLMWQWLSATFWATLPKLLLLHAVVLVLALPLWKVLWFSSTKKKPTTGFLTLTFVPFSTNLASLS